MNGPRDPWIAGDVEVDQALFAANDWLLNVRAADVETVRLIGYLRDVVESLRNRLVGLQK